LLHVDTNIFFEIKHGAVGYKWQNIILCGTWCQQLLLQWPGSYCVCFSIVGLKFDSRWVLPRPCKLV